MDQKMKTIWPLALVLTPLVLPLAAIMLIIFSVTVSVVIPIYEFLSPPSPTYKMKDRSKPMKKKDIRTLVLLLAVSLLLGFLWFGFHFEIDQAPTPRLAQLRSSP